MIFSCRLFNGGIRRGMPVGRLEQKSLKVKLVLCIINITCILLAVYFFYRHNAFCETGGKYIAFNHTIYMFALH